MKFDWISHDIISAKNSWRHFEYFSIFIQKFPFNLIVPSSYAIVSETFSYRGKYEER